MTPIIKDTRKVDYKGEKVTITGEVFPGEIKKSDGGQLMHSRVQLTTDSGILLKEIFFEPIFTEMNLEKVMNSIVTNIDHHLKAE